MANEVRDPAGIIAPTAPLSSAHTTTTNPVCLTGGGMNMTIVYTGLASVANGPSTVDVYPGMFNAAGQPTCVAIPTGTLRWGTATLTPNAAGTVKVFSGATVTQTGASTLAGFNNTILSNVNGTFRTGYFYPAGTPANATNGNGGVNTKFFANKIAADAVMTALGFPKL